MAVGFCDKQIVSCFHCKALICHASQPFKLFLMLKHSLSVFATHILYIAILYGIWGVVQRGKYGYMKWDNESIVKQIQTGQGNRQELLERLWTDNLGLIRKIIHKLTGLQYGYPPDREDFGDMEQQAFIGIMDSVQHYDSTRGKNSLRLRITISSSAFTGIMISPGKRSASRSI